jgi:hypothetical protein
LRSRAPSKNGALKSSGMGTGFVAACGIGVFSLGVDPSDRAHG